MSVAKVINLVGNSSKSWEDAVGQAVEEAAKTIDKITGVEVLNTTGVVKNGKITEYKANVNIAFEVDRSHH